MIERSGERAYSDLWDVSCDHCSHGEEREASSHVDMIRELKRDGWRITLDECEWHHACPDCAKSSAPTESEFMTGYIPGAHLGRGFTAMGTGKNAKKAAGIKCTRVEFLRLLSWFELRDRRPMSMAEMTEALTTPCPAKIKDLEDRRKTAIAADRGETPKRTMKDLLA